MAEINGEIFVTSFAKTMGVENAQVIFQKLLREVGIRPKTRFTPQESESILTHMMTKDNFTKIIANSIKTKLACQQLNNR